jgi:hypothetical protein
MPSLEPSRGAGVKHRTLTANTLPPSTKDSRAIFDHVHKFLYLDLGKARRELITAIRFPFENLRGEVAKL